MNISPEVLNVIKNGKYVNGVFFLPPGQLDRKLYTSVNKVLEIAGGKWDRRQKGHVFAENPMPKLTGAIDNGKIVDPQKEEGFFRTPADITFRMIWMADPIESCNLDPCLWLEPSAGDGAIVDRIIRTPACCGPIMAVEKSAVRCSVLADKYKEMPSINVIHGDFLEQEPEPIADRILMNPPFSKQQDIDHVNHAIKFLAPGGILVAIMGSGVTFRENRKAKDFMEEICLYQTTMFDLPKNSFMESGTGVNTVMLKITKGW